MTFSTLSYIITIANVNIVGYGMCVCICVCVGVQMKSEKNEQHTQYGMVEIHW